MHQGGTNQSRVAPNILIHLLDARFCRSSSKNFDAASGILKQALCHLGDCTPERAGTWHFRFRYFQKNTPSGHQQRASTHKLDAGNCPWAHKLTLSILPYMDGFHECIPIYGLGQLIFQRISTGFPSPREAAGILQEGVYLQPDIGLVWRIRGSAIGCQRCPQAANCRLTGKLNLFDYLAGLSVQDCCPPRVA